MCSAIDTDLVALVATVDYDYTYTYTCIKYIYTYIHIYTYIYMVSIGTVPIRVTVIDAWISSSIISHLSE